MDLSPSLPTGYIVGIKLRPRLDGFYHVAGAWLSLTSRGSGEIFGGTAAKCLGIADGGMHLAPPATRVRRPVYTTKREILRSVLGFFLLN